MNYQNEFNKEVMERTIAKLERYQKYLMSLTPQERQKLAEKEVQRAHKRVAEAARLYPDKK